MLLDISYAHTSSNNNHLSSHEISIIKKKYKNMGTRPKPIC